MGVTCVSVVQWIWRLSINWDAWSAVGTIGAIVVALFLPARMAKREWVRQDQIRQADIDGSMRKIADTQHEVCSAVDRVLAYREAAIALFDSKPVYWVGIQAIKRINLNSKILLNMLDLLEIRPELSDGTVYSAVAAKRIAEATVEQTDHVLKNWGTNDPGWSQRNAVLSELDELASIAKKRSDGVREYYSLGESKSAEEIRSKYLPLSEAIKAAIAADSGEPANNLASSYS